MATDIFAGPNNTETAGFRMSFEEAVQKNIERYRSSSIQDMIDDILYSPDSGLRKDIEADIVVCPYEHTVSSDYENGLISGLSLLSYDPDAIADLYTLAYASLIRARQESSDKGKIVYIRTAMDALRLANDYCDSRGIFEARAEISLIDLYEEAFDSIVSDDAKTILREQIIPETDDPLSILPQVLE